MLASLVANRVDFGGSETRGSLKAPRELTFELDAKAQEYVGEAEKHFDELVGKHDLKVTKTSVISS
jgi:carnitine O-acetyltransferase